MLVLSPHLTLPNINTVYTQADPVSVKKQNKHTHIHD